MQGERAGILGSMDDSWPASPRADELSDSISSHAAEVERTLRALEAVEAFRAEAAALRAELQAARAPQYQRQAFRGVPAPELAAGTWRLILEAGFLVGIALVCWAVHLRRIEIVLVMAASWAVVAVLEAIAWRHTEGAYQVRPPLAMPPPAPEQPVALEPQPEPAPTPAPTPEAVTPDWPERDDGADLTTVLPVVEAVVEPVPELVPAPELVVVALVADEDGGPAAGAFAVLEEHAAGYGDLQDALAPRGRLLSRLRRRKKAPV